MKFSTYFLLLLAVLNLGSLVRCGGSVTPPEYSALFRLPRDEQEQRFKQYPLEKQVEAYLWAMEGVEPPATQFAGFLASNGRKAIAPLLKNLREADSDRRRYYFTKVFEEMHINYYSLKDETEMIETMRTVISVMRDADYRSLSESELGTILGTPGFGG